jgi:hypothetical protein
LMLIKVPYRLRLNVVLNDLFVELPYTIII